jgi:hypothetical protein
MKSFLKRHWITILLIILLVILTFTIRGFIFSFKESYSEGDFHPVHTVQPQQKTMNVTARAQPTVAKRPSVTAIQPWMTFDYVNVVYKLPKNYMKDILGVNDTRYPNIRIDAYAEQSSIDTDLLLTTIRTYITNYQNQH